MKTLVVNLFAGPGAGKTTCAWEIASELKKRGIVTEYVPEYAKELVWDENYEALADQESIFKEQAHRINRLVGKVDVIVTDSPILFSEIYGENNSNDFRARIWDEHNSHDNFNLFINRGSTFEQQGRIHNLEESQEKLCTVFRHTQNKTKMMRKWNYEQGGICRSASVLGGENSE